ncbi:hypothetical protein K492DRAFT_236209, partial [Lichtheimia hyalospora FSU 10163]
MASGQLLVTPVSLRGLEDTEYEESKTFVGCYIDHNDKHRTRSAEGPEPEWNHTLKCTVPAGAVYLQVEVVNEDPEKPGVIGGSRISLYAVFNERSTEEWISIVNSQGEPVGQLLLKLEFDGEYDGGEIESYQATRNLDEEDEEEKKVPDWVKYGGMALGAAAAIGFGVWAYHEYKERKEEEEEEEEAREALADTGYGEAQKDSSDSD